jgi:hypothetical protein
MRRIVVAVLLAVVVAAGAALAHGQWQPKRMDGTGMGLFSAAGDSSHFWRAQIDTLTPERTTAAAVHDTANVLRAELDDSDPDIIYAGGSFYANSMDTLCTKASAATLTELADGGAYLYSTHGAAGIRSWLKNGDGTLTKVDSVTATAAYAAWAAKGYLYTTLRPNTADRKMYSWSSTAGVLAKVDSVTFTHDTYSIGGATLGDTTWVYVSQEPGYVASVRSVAGQMDLIATQYLGANGFCFNVLADSIYVWAANGNDGIVTLTNDRLGNLTVTDTDDTGAEVWYGCANGGDNIYCTASNSIGIFTRSGSTLTNAYLGGLDPGFTTLVSDSTFLFCPGSATLQLFANVEDTPAFISSKSLPTPLYAGTAPQDVAVWDGAHLYIGMTAGIVTYRWSTVQGYLYDIPTATHVLARHLTINADGSLTPQSSYDLSVNNGAAYTRLVAGDDWTISSSRTLKALGKPFTEAVGARALAAIEALPIQTWRFREGDKGQHVGPVAEDWYKVAAMLAPEAAKPIEISTQHEIAALLLSVQELARRDAAQESEIADLRQRVQYLEAGDK